MEAAGGTVASTAAVALLRGFFAAAGVAMDAAGFAFAAPFEASFAFWPGLRPSPMLSASARNVSTKMRQPGREIRLA